MLHKLKIVFIISGILLMPIFSNPHNPSQDDEDEDTGTTRNRKFPPCSCKQKLRTNYITTDVCGRAALCYFEIWNYKKLKAVAKNVTYDEKCDKYMTQKYICLVGYPKPMNPNAVCYTDLQKCEQVLAKMLYEDCEPLRTERNLLKPEEVKPEIRTEDLNFNLSSVNDRRFQALPTSDKTTHNNFYIISCPIIYRFPYFTIDFLLKSFNPNVNYDETYSLKKVAAMLPRYVREGVNKERLLNFDAMSLDENLINWCGIPRNYICIEEELDGLGQACLFNTLENMRKQCEPDVPAPRNKTVTKVAIYGVGV